MLKNFSQDGLLIYLGDSSHLGEKDISRSLEGVFKNWSKLVGMAKKSQALVDGKGTERVVEYLMKKKEK